MSVIDEEIEVDAPLRETYDQWTQFEEFPVFMEGVEEVRQLDDTRLHWVASIAGVRREWDARITQQIPDQLIAWTSMEGTRNDGLVTFDAVGAHRTHITLRLDLEPDGAIESIGDALGVVRARARGDLARFKAFLESRDGSTGAWRGEVLEGDVVPSIGTEPGDGAVDVTRPEGSPGEVPASTGGVVDLDRVIGNIPLLLVFVEPLGAPSTSTVLESLGRHLVEFGRDRVQLLAVARVGPEAAEAAIDGLDGNVRLLADPRGELAQRYGVEYRAGGSVTVLVGADGRHEATWVDDDGEGLADALRLRLGQLSDH